MEATATKRRNNHIEFWNEVLVPKFTRFKHILVGALTNHSDKILAKLDLQEGDQVVDIGCGFGDTAIELARRVGPSGAVLAIDCCNAFLEHGRRDAAAAGIENIAFVEGDAQILPFEPVHDFCFSRLGTQFFEDPRAGLRNMRTALKPGGRIVMMAWRTIEDNPWLGLPKQAVMEILPPPGENARNGGPGPFSMADQAAVTKELEGVGYDDITFERVDLPMMVGRTIEDAVAFHLTLGPAGEMCREAGEIAKQHHEDIVGALRATLAQHETPEGIKMDSSSWWISARNSG